MDKTAADKDKGGVQEGETCIYSYEKWNTQYRMKGKNGRRLSEKKKMEFRQVERGEVEMRTRKSSSDVRDRFSSLRLLENRDGDVA